jgi:coproporphyrinogen III oxidase-like Fe-S oxidoreductase
MGLRLAEGVDPRRFASLAGAPLRRDRVAELGELGLVEESPERLRVTPAGRPVLDAVLRRLLA